jgi:methyl-accepting chemotaxis protein
MTIKLKIVSGFVVMIAIVVFISVIGNKGLEGASKLFLEFVRLSSINTTASDSVSDINESAYYLEKFMRLSDTADVDRAIAAQEKTLAGVRKISGLSAKPERKELMDRTAARLQEYVEALKDMKKVLSAWYGDYQGIILQSFAAAYKNLGEIGDMALQVNNSLILGQINDMWRILSGLNAALADFRRISSERNAARVDDLLLKIQPLNERFRDSLITEAGQRVFALYQAQYDAIVRAYRKHRGEALRIDAVLAQTYLWDEEVTTALTRTNREAGQEEDEERAAITASNDSTEKFMLATSIFGLVLGTLFAVFIIFSLISVLNKVAAFAGAVADGDFDRDAGIREKGEIGKMVAALSRIPLTLKSILADYLSLEKQIENGAIDRKGDATRHHGGFSTLINGTNDILARLMVIIDNIPSPVVVLNKDTRIEYMNEAAKAVGGAEYRGKTCRQVFNREDDGSASDALKKAAETRLPAHSETRAHPGGKEMDVSYTAIPMLDKDGKLVAIIQLLTDLTAVKTQQKTILQVAAQASEISGRVAAASEELAAQVEEVSRGTEMQRARVESTASAMSEMNSTVLEVARNASQASEQSELTRSRAGTGSELVNQVVQSINQVNKVASVLQSNMQGLGSQAESIGGVMNVISDIADQTNLLALNAAIEAARAGEAGRGFAVVADEVRKLAEKTMSATQEVSASINAIQHSTRTNIDEVNTAVKSITEATGLANSSGAALKEIVDLASTNSSVVASIATAAEEQSATSDEINRAIEEINHIVGETANGMIQSAAAVQELAGMAQQLNRVMDSLK